MASSMEVGDYSQGGYKVVIVAALLIIMQSLMVAGRFVSRKLQKVVLAVDDFVLVFATVLTLGLCALAVAFPKIAGVGADLDGTDVAESKLIGKSFMAWMVVYGFSVMFAKCAILLLYIRVFTTQNRAFAITAYFVGFVIVATGIANAFRSIFQCSPVAYGWDKSIQGGICMDEVVFARYMAIPNIFTGAVMLIMPIPLVWRLNLSISHKIALTATFLHGIIGFIASCARLVMLFQSSSTININETSIIWTIWTINEPANYIIAACLPTLRPIFVRILPASFFVLTHKRSRQPHTSSLKVSWPRGSMRPQFHLETKNFQSNDQLTGPWNTQYQHTSDVTEFRTDVEASTSPSMEDKRAIGKKVVGATRKEHVIIEKTVELNL